MNKKGGKENQLKLARTGIIEGIIASSRHIIVYSKNNNTVAPKFFHPTSPRELTIEFANHYQHQQHHNQDSRLAAHRSLASVRLPLHHPLPSLTPCSSASLWEVAFEPISFRLCQLMECRSRVCCRITSRL